MKAIVVRTKKASRKSLNDLTPEGQTLDADNQYSFGTGMALDASQVLFNGVLQGLNNIFSKNKGSADGNIFNVPQEGQIMAMGGEVDDNKPPLFKTDKRAYVDSVLNANKNLEWVQRLKSKTPQSIQVPGEPYRSTHLMSDDGNGYVFPRIVADEKGKLKDLGDNAEDYARSNNTGIQLPKEEGSWFAANGYKSGTGVLNSINSKGIPYNNSKYQVPTSNLNDLLDSYQPANPTMQQDHTKTQFAFGGGVTPANAIGAKVGAAIQSISPTPTITDDFDPNGSTMNFLNAHQADWGIPRFVGGDATNGYRYDLTGSAASVVSNKTRGLDNNFYTPRSQASSPTPNIIKPSANSNFAMGGEVKIKPSHKGRFTAWAKEHGMSVSEAASHVVANKSKYSSKVFKMAQFAKNFAALGDSSLQPINQQDQQNVPVEVEGNEVAQMPNGQVGQFQGPSHEDGGISANLPQGTKIYSDRLSVDGKSMQARKLSREKSISKLTGMLDKNPTDALNRNTYNRMKSRADMEEQQDLMMQDAASQIYSKVPHLQDASSGFQTPMENQQEQYQGQQDAGQVQPAGMTKQFATGTGQDGVDDPYPWSVNPITQANDALFTPKRLGAPIGMDNATFNPRLPSTNQVSTLDDSPNIHDKINTDMPYSTGDNLGFLGNAISGTLPLATTIANRAGDKPNVNTFQNFGRDAIEANSQGMGFLNTVKNEALKNASLNATGQRARNRNSASSVGTSRALDLATSGQEDISENNIYSSYAQQMAGMYNEKSKLSNQQDLYTDTGAQTAAKEDRMDRDSYYTNLAQNLGNIGHVTQQTGKEMNEHDYNNQSINLLQYLNKYGLGMTYNPQTGQWEQTQVKKAG